MIIRPMIETDRAAVVAMMREFYASPAVDTNGSEEIFAADVDACVGESAYAEGFVFETEPGDTPTEVASTEVASAEADAPLIAGYSMVAKSFSTEFGKPCIWVEDIYLLPEYRGRGLAGRLFAYLEERFPDAIFRLEVEEENIHAVTSYMTNGFTFMPYLEMIKGVDR